MSGNGVTLEGIIGYDPWNFPVPVNPSRDFSWVLFGWAYTEAMECISILIGARKRWKSPVYLGIAFAVTNQLLATTSMAVRFSTSDNVYLDFFIGPMEWTSTAILLTSQLLSRWGYYFATVSITLAVFPRNRTVRILLYAVTAFAAIANITYYCITMHFCKMAFDLYVDFNMPTGDPFGVLSGTMNVVLPYIIKHFGTASLFDNSATFIFIVLTKIPFLLKIYKSLDVGPLQILWGMITTRSSQRLVLCIIMATIDSTLSLTLGVNPIGVVMSVYSKLFQINSLSILAFEGAAAIVKEHSTAATRIASTDVQKSGVSSTRTSVAYPTATKTERV